MLLQEFSSRVLSIVGALPLGAKRRVYTDPSQKWFPYYAGYSLDFAEAMLRAAKLPKNGIVFDPWNGSGTTTLAAKKSGYAAYGFDLNPIAVLVAKAKLVSPHDARGIRGLAREIASSVSPKHGGTSDSLSQWLNLSNVGEFRQIQKRIVEITASPASGCELSISDDSFPPLAAFMLLALVRSAKSLVPRRCVSNPTIFRVEPECRHNKAKLKHVWLKTLTEMGDQLPLTPMSDANISIAVRDSRIRSLPDDCIDFVLTSPPYCTRLDYADTTIFELAAIGPSENNYYNSLRRELMGAPLVRESTKPEIPLNWPASVKDLLSNIRQHPSKASDSYYYKTYWQYFNDAILSMNCISKSLKPNALAAIVVQSSYYKNILVDLPALYVDIAKACNLSANVAFDLPVRTVISSIHPGTKRYRANPDYRESVVVFKKD